MFLPPQLRSAVLMVLVLVSYLGVTGVLRQETEATPGSPGTPQPGTVIDTEDFETGQGSQLTRLPTYTGPDGQKYYTDPPYGNAGSCLDLLGSMQWPATDPNPSASGCKDNVDGGWATHRTMAGHLGTLAGGNANQNHALTFVGNGSNGTTGSKEFATVTGSTLATFSNPTGRYLALGFDILGRTTGSGSTCAPHDIKVSGELLFRDGSGGSENATGVLGTANPCDSPDQTFSGAPAGSFKAKRFVTKAVPVSNTYVQWGYRLRIAVAFKAGTAGSNNSTLFAIDNVRLIDASPQLDQAFSPTSVDIGATSKLTYTITNTTDLSAKDGLAFVNTLPSGLRAATPSNATNNCGGSAPTVSSGSTISAQGKLAQGQASCTISVDVTSSAVATYTNQPSNFTTLTRLQAPGSAQVSFTNPPNVSITKTARDPSSGGQVSTYTAGSNIDFRFDVNNAGPGNATGLRVTDTLPVGFTGTGWTADPGWNCTLNARDVNCTKSTMPVSTNRITIHASVASSATGAKSNTATLVADYNANSNPTSSVTLSADPQADLSVSKLHAAPPVAGASLDYDLSVGNAGPSDVGSFTITDPLPAGLTFVSSTPDICSAAAQLVTCTGGALAKNGSASITLTVDVASDFPGGPLSNTATVAPPAGTTDPNSSNDSATDTTGVDTSADLQITKTHPGGATAVAGTDTAYTISVLNAGPSTDQPAGNITVTDTLPGGMSYVDATGTDWQCTGPGGTVRCTLQEVLQPGATAPPITLTVHVGALIRGAVTNTASVSATVPDPNPDNNSSSVPVTVTAEADLGIVKSHTGPFVGGSEQTFTIEVTNHGPSSESPSFTVTDTLDPDLTFVRANGDATCPTPSGQEVICTGGVLNPNQTATFTITVLVATTPPGEIDNTATVSPPAGTTDPNPSNDSDTDTGQTAAVADLAITKNDRGTFFAGGTGTYEIEVRNNGPSDVAGFEITDALDPSLTFDGETGATCIPAGNDLTCTGGALAATDSTTVTIRVTVNADVPDGTTIDNTATVAPPDAVTDPDIGNNSDSHTVTVAQQADLSIVKAHVGDGFVAGRNGQYEITVTNNGPSDVGDFTIGDTLNGDFGFVSANPDICTGPTQLVTCDGAALAAGAAVTITLTVSVAPGIPDQTSVDNTATVGSTVDDPVTGNNSSTDTVIIGAEADLAITKTQVGAAVAGGTFEFQFEVKNNGPSHVLSFTLTDSLDPRLTFDPAASDPDCNHVQQDVTCTGGPLDAGGTAQVTIAVSVAADVPEGTRIGNTAQVEPPSDVNDPAQANNTSPITVEVTTEADLSVEKQHVDEFVAGRDGKYEITVTNRGPSTVPTGEVTVHDELPEGLSFDSATGADWRCTHAGREVTCHLDRAMAAGEKHTVTLHVRIHPTAHGETPNHARGSSPLTDPETGNDTGSDTVDIRSHADLRLTKEALGPLTAGHQATYRLRVTNHEGPSVARDVTIHDELPSYLHYRSHRGEGWDCRAQDREVTCRMDRTLGVDESATVELIVLVDQEAPDRAVNHARVSFRGTDPTPAEASHSSRVRREADLEIDLSHDQRQYAAGEIVVFTYTVINHGPSAAQDVVLTHILPDGLSFVDDAIGSSAAMGSGAMGSGAGAAPAGLVLAATSAQAWPFSCTFETSQRLVCRTETLLVGTYQLQVEARIWDDFTGSFTSELLISSSTPDPNLDGNNATDQVPEVLPFGSEPGLPGGPGAPGGPDGPLPATGLGLMLLLAGVGSALLGSGVYLAYGRRARRRASPRDGAGG